MSTVSGLVLTGFRYDRGDCLFADFSIRNKFTEHPNLEIYTRLCGFIARGYTQERIAKDCRLSASTISRYVNRATRKSGWIHIEDKLIEWMKHALIVNPRDDEWESYSIAKVFDVRK